MVVLAATITTLGCTYINLGFALVDVSTLRPIRMFDNQLPYHALCNTYSVYSRPNKGMAHEQHRLRRMGCKLLVMRSTHMKSGEHSTSLSPICGQQNMQEQKKMIMVWCQLLME